MQHKFSNALLIQHAEVLSLCLFTWMTFSSSANHKRSIKHMAYGNCLVDSQEHGLFISLSKCKLGVNEVDFLGHHVNQQGVFPLPEKVDCNSLISQTNHTKTATVIPWHGKLLSQICAISCCSDATTLQGHRYETETTCLDFGTGYGIQAIQGSIGCGYHACAPRSRGTSITDSD